MKSDLRITLSQTDIESQNSIKILPKQKPKTPKNKNLNKNYLDVDFIAPDGGWGWMVVIAAGISILVTCGVFQQLEILFKQRYETIGINSSQITTIFRTQLAASTCTGLFIGEIFHRFTFRQISFVGGIFTFTGIALSVLTDSLMSQLLTVSIMCGIGRTLIFTSSHIVVYTYFEEKRLSAIACMYSIAGLGPILLPYLSTYLLGQFGVTWAVLFYAGLSLHNLICSLIYQPIKMHMIKQEDIELLDQVRPLNLIFGSRQMKKLNALEIPTDSNDDLSSQRSFPSNLPYPLRVPKNSCASFAPLSRPIPKIILPDETEYFESPQEVEESTSSQEEVQKLTIFQKILRVLDLSLLKDFSFINLAIGLALINFVETYYSLLTPFILKDFAFNESQVSKAMSWLSFCDMAMRISLPIFGRCLNVSHKYGLLLALMGMFIGRAILVFSRNFTVVLICFGWMGLCKAIRIVFWLLILPNYVPLKKLPGAIGLEEVICGLMKLALGPLIGLIRDGSHFSLILHCMNSVCLIVAFAWLGEDLFKRKKTKLQIN